MTKHTVIRTIYLYLFSLVGLVLIIIGCVNFIDMGLKAWVFTAAEQQEQIDYERPIEPYMLETKFEGSTSASDVELTEEEYQKVQTIITEYNNWEEKKDKTNYIAANRARRASINLSMILVGIPLYLYHWITIRREKKALEK